MDDLTKPARDIDAPLTERERVAIDHLRGHCHDSRPCPICEGFRQGVAHQTTVAMLAERRAVRAERLAIQERTRANRFTAPGESY